MIEDFKRFGAQAWAGYKANLQVWLITGLIFCLVTPASLLLLGGVLYAGIFMMWVEWYREETKPDLKSLQDYLPQLLPLTLAFIAVVLITSVGLAVFVIPGLLLGALFLWTIPCAVEQNEDMFWDAMIDSKDLVLDSAQSGGLPRHILAVLLVCIVGMIPNLVFFWFTPAAFLLTALVTFPLTTGFLAAFYVDATDESKVVDEE